jgi:hypothetical protein
MCRLAWYFFGTLAFLSFALCTTLCTMSVEVRHPRQVASLLILPVLLPSAWAWLFIRQQLVLRRRKVAGQCLMCGYDLCATPDRCPECGSVATSSRNQNVSRSSHN